MVLNWLRSKLRKWLAEERRIDALECYIDQKIKRVAVEGVAGVKLMVTDGTGTWLVGPEQCLDRGDFWRAWEQRSPNGLVWEGGDAFDPKDVAK